MKYENDFIRLLLFREINCQSNSYELVLLGNVQIRFYNEEGGWHDGHQQHSFRRGKTLFEKQKFPNKNLIAILIMDL